MCSDLYAYVLLFLLALAGLGVSSFAGWYLVHRFRSSRWLYLPLCLLAAFLAYWSLVIWDVYSAFGPACL